jgi:neutral ceramidase
MDRRLFLGAASGMALLGEGPAARAGFAEMDITPAIGSEIPGNYFKQYHQRLHDPCKVRAGYFESGGKAVCLIGVDALMVPRHLVEKVRARVPGVELLIGASHSHSSGPVGMVQPGEFDHASAEVQELAYRVSSAADAGYLKLLEDQLVRAVEAARKNALPGLWGYGAGMEDKAIFNRRFRMKTGVTNTHPRPGNPDLVKPAGPVDGTVTVLGVFNDAKQLTGCVVNYSCHATTSPPGISANWIYWMERAIRGAFGEGVVVVFLQGFSGDVTQVDNLDTGRVPMGIEYGRLVGGRVGAEAVKVLLSMEPGAPGDVNSVSMRHPEGMRMPGEERIRKAWETVRAASEKRGAEYVFAKEIVLLEAMQKKARSVDVELQAIAIGPMAFAAAPGEMFVELGLAIRKASPFAYTSPVSLANGCVGYVPTREAFAETGGGYEQRLSSYTNLVPEAGDRMVRESLALLAKLKPGTVPKREAGAAFTKGWDYGAVGPDNPAVTPKQMLELFNGRDLTNFYTYTRESRREDPNRVFVVEGGVLRISGQEWGGIVTREQYRDYRLLVDWRWGTKTWNDREKKARDSGILIHGFGPDGGYNGIWLESFESQIIEGGTGDILVVAKETAMSAACRCSVDGNETYFEPVKGEKMVRSKGRINWHGRSRQWKDEVNFRGAADVERARGQWNRQEVIACEDRMVCLLNGKVVAGAYDLSHTQGKIQVQSEGAEIFVRRIALIPLTAADRKLAAGIG